MCLSQDNFLLMTCQGREVFSQRGLVLAKIVNGRFNFKQFSHIVPASIVVKLAKRKWSWDLMRKAQGKARVLLKQCALLINFSKMYIYLMLLYEHYY